MKQKWTEAPTSKYINNRNSSGQSLKIKDNSSPKCQKEKMALSFIVRIDIACISVTKDSTWRKWVLFEMQVLNSWKVERAKR
jgi:hypothetical protein